MPLPQSIWMLFAYLASDGARCDSSGKRVLANQIAEGRRVVVVENDAYRRKFVVSQRYRVEGSSI